MQIIIQVKILWKINTFFNITLLKQWHQQNKWTPRHENYLSTCSIALKKKRKSYYSKWYDSKREKLDKNSEFCILFVIYNSSQTNFSQSVNFYRQSQVFSSVRPCLFSGWKKKIVSFHCRLNYFIAQYLTEAYPGIFRRARGFFTPQKKKHFKSRFYKL